MNSLGEVVARYVYSDGEGSRQNGVGQLATRLGANQDTSLPFSGSNVPEVIELLDASGAVTQILMLSINQVGSVQLVADAATGEVVQRIEYDEFGRILADSAPGMQPFGFAGGLYDVETQLVRFGARAYSADVGRWVARDPVRFGVSEETGGYAYVQNDGLNTVDPHGFGAASTSCKVAVSIACRQSCRANNKAGPAAAWICSIVCSAASKFLWCDPADSSPPPEPPPKPQDPNCDPSMECCSDG